MIILRVEKSKLARQVHEGYLIANHDGNHLLNKKGEWGQNLAPTLGLEDQSNDAGKLLKRGRKGGKSKETQKCKRVRLNDDEDQVDPDASAPVQSSQTQRDDPTEV